MPQIVDPFSAAEYGTDSYALAAKAGLGRGTYSEQQWERSKKLGQWGALVGRRSGGGLRKGAIVASSWKGNTQFEYRFGLLGKIEAFVAMEGGKFYPYRETEYSVFEEEMLEDRDLRMMGFDGQYLPGSAVGARRSVGKMPDVDVALMASTILTRVKRGTAPSFRECEEALAQFIGYSADDVSRKIDRASVDGNPFLEEMPTPSKSRRVPIPPRPGSSQADIDRFNASVKNPRTIDASAVITWEAINGAIRLLETRPRKGRLSQA